MATYTDSFETDFGNWSAVSATGDMLTADLLRNSGGTSSSDTGPSSAYDGSYYVYMEGSNRGSGTIDFRLTPTLSGDSRISFAYHMYSGDSPDFDMGALSLEALVSGIWVPFWGRARNQGDQWFFVDKLIVPAGAAELRFLFGATVDFDNDMAIDLITVEDGLTLTHNEHTSLETPITESFEDQTFGIFTESSTDLQITSGSTPSGGTGPSAASDGTYYVFYESSAGYINVENTLTYSLLNGNGGYISFDLNLYGNDKDMGGVMVETSVDGVTWDTIYARAGQTDSDAWINIPDIFYPSGATEIRFRTFRGSHGDSNPRSDMAIDNIIITEASGGTALQPPTNLRVVNISPTETRLEWDAP